MPNYPKTTRVEYWRTTDSFQDLSGAWHQGRPMQVGTFWGNFKGKDYSLLYQTTGVWSKPVFEITITRPKHNAPKVGDHMRHDGAFYEIKQVNDLTGAVGADMRLICELDEYYC